MREVKAQAFPAELERATPDEFFDRPQHPRARQFLADLCSPFGSMP